jgi:prophage antirepressor-like protein
MTTDDVIFEFNEWPIRVRVVAGAPWFRGNDVAAALGTRLSISEKRTPRPRRCE